MNEQDSKDAYLWWLVTCLACLVALSFWLCGCHSVHGFGQDLQDMTSDYVEREQ
jgi:predicted small secreted protein